MAAKFKMQDEVVQIVPAPIQGAVTQRKVDGDDDLFLVEWTNDEGEPMSRWFREDEIQLVS